MVKTFIKRFIRDMIKTSNQSSGFKTDMENNNLEIFLSNHYNQIRIS